MLHERTKVRKADACLCSVTTNQFSLFVQPNTAHFRHIYTSGIYTLPAYSRLYIYKLAAVKLKTNQQHGR
jgi:hypothetical protein